MNKPKTALYVDKFLPYTHGWIWRQISDGPAAMDLVICQERIEEEAFPFEDVVIARPPGKTMARIKGKLWALYKHLPYSPDKYSRQVFKKALTDRDIELVHSHFGTNGVMIQPVCDELNIPHVVTFHGFDISSAPQRWPAYKRELQKLFQKIRFAIVISEEMGDRVARMGCPREKILVSYLGVPLDEYPYADRSGHKGPVRFLHAGRITGKKGLPDLIRAFARAFPDPGAAVLEVAGDGEEYDEVVKTIEEVKPVNRVNMHGRLSDEELKDLRKKADVFVLNCRVDKQGTKEGLPISTLEAAATGLPAISTYHAGIPESILDEETGYLVKEFDTGAFAEKMRKLTDKKRRLKMGNNARRFMERKFDLNVCNKRLSEIYQEAIKRN